MKTAAFAVVLASTVLANGDRSQAADLGPYVGTATPILAPTTRPITRVYVRRAVYARRTIGMPCVLPPQVIVQRNWNGPQCRWVDNVIPGDRRVRYRIAARW
jgi:hypothetical protein